MGPQLERLANVQGNFRLRKIDVVSWDSPVSRAHGIRRLPTLKLYRGPELVSEDSQEILRILQK